MNLFGMMKPLVWMSIAGSSTSVLIETCFLEELVVMIGYQKDLKGRTKLQGSQIIDAQSLFALIGNKTTNEGGFQVINDNNLVLILEQIQELSDLGEHELAEALKTFINEELVTGKLSASVDFDVAFKEWQENRQFAVIKEFAGQWGW